MSNNEPTRRSAKTVLYLKVYTLLSRDLSSGISGRGELEMLCSHWPRCVLACTWVVRWTRCPSAPSLTDCGSTATTPTKRRTCMQIYVHADVYICWIIYTHSAPQNRR